MLEGLYFPFRSNEWRVSLPLSLSLPYEVIPSGIIPLDPREAKATPLLVHLFDHFPSGSPGLCFEAHLP